jgi:hypothetical protein
MKGISRHIRVMSRAALVKQKQSRIYYCASYLIFIENFIKHNTVVSHENFNFLQLQVMKKYKMKKEEAKNQIRAILWQNILKKPKVRPLKLFQVRMALLLLYSCKSFKILLKHCNYSGLAF